MNSNTLKKLLNELQKLNRRLDILEAAVNVDLPDMD